MQQYVQWQGKEQRPPWDRWQHRLVTETDWQSGPGNLPVQEVLTHLHEYGRPPMDCVTLYMPMNHDMQS